LESSRRAKRLEAEIVLEYDDAKIAESIAKAVSPDNFKTPRRLSIKTIQKANKVSTQIRSEGKLSTFIATIDDLLFCISTAEKAVQIAKSFDEKFFK
jgi:tRNA threonylcarbamoyladenosine modification (KEOPS) complex  Pcc1 subunit